MPARILAHASVDVTPREAAPWKRFSDMIEIYLPELGAQVIALFFSPVWLSEKCAGNAGRLL